MLSVTNRNHHFQSPTIIVIDFKWPGVLQACWRLSILPCAKRPMPLSQSKDFYHKLFRHRNLCPGKPWWTCCRGKPFRWQETLQSQQLPTAKLNTGVGYTNGRLFEAFFAGQGRFDGRSFPLQGDPSGIGSGAPNRQDAFRWFCRMPWWCHSTRPSSSVTTLHDVSFLLMFTRFFNAASSPKWFTSLTISNPIPL